MRSVFAAVLAVISSVRAIPTAIVTTRKTKAAFTLEETTDYYLFHVTIDQFMTARAAEDGTALGLNWTANGCSSAPDNPFGFNSLKSCTRHDFGYRNYKQQKRCGSAHKKLLDANFRNDMYTQCRKERDERTRDACETIAFAYYSSVRVFGTLHFCNFDS